MQRLNDHLARPILVTSLTVLEASVNQRQSHPPPDVAEERVLEKEQEALQSLNYHDQWVPMCATQTASEGSGPYDAIVV